jgi:Na+-transporting NADH:ubiquinone oxidoreductase subunit C
LSALKDADPVAKSPSNFAVIRFVVILSVICALILSTMASVLKDPKEQAKQLDQSEQMMIAARIFTHEGYFQIKDESNTYVPAQADSQGFLTASKEIVKPNAETILTVYNRRIKPYLVNKKGEITTFSKAQIEEKKYLEEFKKSGYYQQNQMLIYEILKNEKEATEKNLEGYVIPVNGQGLWDAIYGYIAVETDGDTVIGISWYEHAETPGLGALIAEQSWQKNFYGKKIFQGSSSGKTDLSTAPLGIVVVKGKVSEVYANSPKAQSAVDGMSGATLTGTGVTDAYRNVLSAYRPFFEKIQSKEI